VHPGLGSLEHPHGALELEIARVGHLDLDQEVRHAVMVRPAVARRHPEEHRLAT